MIFAVYLAECVEMRHVCETIFTVDMSKEKVLRFYSLVDVSYANRNLSKNRISKVCAFLASSLVPYVLLYLHNMYLLLLWYSFDRSEILSSFNESYHRFRLVSRIAGKVTCLAKMIYL